MFPQHDITVVIFIPPDLLVELFLQQGTPSLSVYCLSHDLIWEISRTGNCESLKIQFVN